MAINSINGLSSITPITFGKNDNVDNNKMLNFGDMLNNAINSVNDLQIESRNLGLDLAVGKTDNIHEVVIAGEKADVAFQLMMQVRNKIMDAYSEIMRMQI